MKSNALSRRAGVAVVAAVTAITGYAGYALTAGTAVEAADENVVNIYSYRQEFLIRPFLEAFEKDTGIKVNVVYAKKGLTERLKAEGMNSPADVLLTADISRLDGPAKDDLLQPVSSDVLNTNVPSQYRHPDGLWFGLTTRARLIYYAKDRVRKDELSTYEDLADPRWKGRICVRPGSHVYNRALVASMIAAHGEAKAEEWTKALVANFARKPQGNDRGQVKAIKEGVCDIAIGNSYYMGKMKTNEKKPEQKEWAASAGIFFPNQGDRGTHVNISGAALTKSSKHRDNAVRLLEFLTEPLAQEMYASVNFEYPVKADVKWNGEVASWGKFKSDTVPLQTIADLSPAASRMIDRAGWE